MAKQERATESHAAIWRDANGALVTGKVVLGADALRLQGMTRQGSSSVYEVPYAELAGVGIGRGPEERLNGRPTLVLNRSSAPPLLLDVLGIGMLSELSDLLATLAAEHAAPREHLTVIVPLKSGTVERARALIEQGPPFDPEQSGLERHEVFFSEREVVFLFEGRQASGFVQQLVNDPSGWRAALDWRRLLAGPPRIARSGFTWSWSPER